MMDLRAFFSLLVVCLLVSPYFALPVRSDPLYSTLHRSAVHGKSPSAALPPIRPAPSDRKFNSTAINALIDDFTSRMSDPDLATLFSNCLPCTLDTTVELFTPRTKVSPPDAFIITGDITAQWLRDSTNQLLPYVPYTTSDPTLKDLVCGLIRRQSANILHDPYANAFNVNASGAGHQDDYRHPAMTPLVFEGKWELDSVSAAMKLAWHYWNATGDSTCFLEDDLWFNAVTLIISTITVQQNATVPPKQAEYYFQRTTSSPTDSQMLGGVGNVGRWTGMCKSAFRPSDDSTLFPFFIPANSMAVVELNHISQLLKSLSSSSLASSARSASLFTLATTASALADVIDGGIKKYGIIPVPSWTAESLAIAAGSSMYAYEVDGYGGQNIMDDANIPSLLALPYLGYVDRSDPIYLATRKVVLSSNNPYWFQGSAGEGIGGPHDGLDYVWPMSVITRAMSSLDDKEIMACLELLKTSSAGTGWLHESFNKDNMKDFTRPWFAWVNGLFGQLIIQLAAERPYLIFKQSVNTAHN